MKHVLKSTLLIALTVLMTFMYSCDEDEDTPPPADTKDVKLSTDPTLGSILVDANGVTLYFFTSDTKVESNCEGGCLNAWPVFHAENPEVDTGLDASDFGEITRGDGDKQTTYKGWPLYYYSPGRDGEIESAGATAGEGVGGVWFVAKTDYSIMLANAQLIGQDGKSYLEDYTEGEGATPYFVDGNGRTMYIFARDYANINTFTAADLSNNNVWPIFHETIASIPSILNSDDFGEITIHGEQQLTYKDWPLYYFGQDVDRGDNKGVSVPAPGVWPIVNTDTEAAPEFEPTVKLMEDDQFGEILVDREGRTLYFFTRDANGANNCTGGCAEAWPAFYAEIKLAEDSELESGDFDEITLDGDARQTTYKGWPLYYYSPGRDGTIEPAGEVGGDGVGTVWYVAKESYGLMIADAQLVGNDGKNYTGNYEEGDGATTYFTDAYGHTLYIFVNDSKDTNNFTESDFSNDGIWPIFHVDSEELPSALNVGDFGEIDVFGKKQLTFKGWPVYYFGQDENRGDNKGVSVPSPGIWPILNNDLAAAE